MSAQHEKLKEILAEATGKATAAERAAYLDGACGQDTELRARVEALLQAHDSAGAFLEESVLRPADAPIGEGPGDVIGHYKLLEQIGEGGFGVVFMAEQLEPIRRRVALKVIKPGMDTKQVIARFEAERQALALMDHPNIARVFEAGATATGRPYFVMELVPGVPLTRFCDANDFSPQERLRLFMTVCEAVQHAHQKGVIHRDLKPSNILVTLHDGKPVPKVIDFGTAKALQQPLTEKTLFTAYGRLIGTPQYMSPEQAELSGLDVDTRADIYSLGVLLYELLTGTTPFEAERLRTAAFEEMMRIIRQEDPPRPSTRVSTLDERATEIARHRQVDPKLLQRSLRGDLDWIVMKALEKDRSRRYETASALAEDLQRHRDHQPVQARPPSTAYRTRKFIRRHRAGVALAASVTAALIAGLVVSSIGFQRARVERDHALLAEAKAEKQKARAEQLADQEAEQRQRAEAEAVKSAQVARFLQDMLEGVGPAVALGRDTTMLREILDKTAERVSQDLNDQPEVKAELQYTMGRVYTALGVFDQAEALHREALAIRRRLFGNESAEVAASLHGLARVFEADHNTGKAEPLYREALAIRRKVLGNEHVDVAASLRGLASSVQGVVPGSMQDSRKWVEAEALWREALAMQRKLLGAEHPDTLTSLDGLGYNLGRFQGRLDEAGRLTREALALRRKLYGSDHPDLAQSLSALGQILERQGNLAEAETLRREALEMRRRLFGNEHPRVLETCAVLGLTLLKQGKLAEAEAAFREVLEAEGDLPKTGVKRGALRNSAEGLAEVFHRQGGAAEMAALRGRWTEFADGGDAELLNFRAWLLATFASSGLRDGPGAVVLAEKAVALTSRTNAAYLNTLAAAYAEAGQFTNAVNVQQEAIALLTAEEERKNYAFRLRLYASGIPYHDHGGLATLAHALLDEGKFAEAEAVWRKELALEKARSGEEHPWVANSLVNLAGVLERQGKFTEAEQRYREALAIRRKVLDSEDPALAGVLAGLTHFLIAQSNFTEAEPLARECLALRDKLIPDDWLTFNARSLLGASLLGQKKYAEAEPLLLSGYEGIQQRQASIPAQVRTLRPSEALQRLVQLYEATGRPAQAAEWKQKLAEFQKAESEKQTAGSKP